MIFRRAVFTCISLCTCSCSRPREETHAPLPTASASQAAVPAASSPTFVETDAGAATPSEAAATSQQVPNFSASLIGMHIGGGPNDAATKAPLERSVLRSLASFERCTHGVDSMRGASYGVDLLIAASGGKAEVTEPRTTLTDSAFRSCMQRVWSDIEFEKPRTGKTRVSISLQFKPREAHTPKPR